MKNFIPHQLLKSSNARRQAFLFGAAAMVATVTWNSSSNIAYEFIVLGVIGAIFANVTGAGGGVVFIPTFNQLGLGEAAAVATSFGIQTFGMTAGAIAWLVKFSDGASSSKGSLKLIAIITLLLLVPTIAGLYSVNLSEWHAPSGFGPFFAWFSIALGVCILATLIRRAPNALVESLNVYDVIALLLIGYLGGIVTAWLSVGVGELVAFYLIARGFNPSLAIACAVVITALGVWSVAPITFAAESAAVMNIILAAGPAAVVGGLCARHIVDRLPLFWLKVFFGCWLILIGLYT